jgi:exopolysaccharide biosynthesis polyprenyl glycosylphosphotransferase
MLAAAAVATGRSAVVGGPSVSAGWLAAFAGATLGMLVYFRIYRPRFAPHLLDDVRKIIAATAVAAMAITFVRVLAGEGDDAASEAVRAWLFAAVYLASGRGAMQLVQMRLRRRGAAARPTLVVGAGQVGHLVVRRLHERPELGLRPVAFFDHDPLDAGGGTGLPVYGEGTLEAADPIGFAAELEHALRELGIRHVVVAFSPLPHEVELELVQRCQQQGVSVSLVPRLFERLPDEIELERLGGVPLVTVYPSNPRGWQFATKYTLDRVLALIGIVLLSPLLAIAAIGVLISLGRPILFRQTRVGLDGREFEMVKFRTMRGRPEDLGEADADWADEVVGESRELAEPARPGSSEDGQSRATGFGALLRRFGIDELPQLLNVLRGEMAIVGPRPERRAYVAMFERTVRRYGERHRVKAGITGWAQVHGFRGKTPLMDRIEWDNYYIENWSPWLDFKIILLTFVAVFRGASD